MYVFLNCKNCICVLNRIEKKEFWYCLKRTVPKFNNSKIQKKFLHLHKINEEIKSSLLIQTLLQKVYSVLLQNSFAYNLVFYFNMGNEDIYHSPPHVSVITGNILITIIRFARYHLLASNSTFMTDSMYLGIIQICQNLNEYYYYLVSNTSMIWQIDADCSPFPGGEYTSFSYQSRTLKTNLLGLISNFSKYYFKTGTICLLFLSSHVFTALEFDSNHFGILLWNIV